MEARGSGEAVAGDGCESFTFIQGNGGKKIKIKAREHGGQPLSETASRKQKSEPSKSSLFEQQAGQPIEQEEKKKDCQVPHPKSVAVVQVGQRGRGKTKKGKTPRRPCGTHDTIAAERGGRQRGFSPILDPSGRG